jgi:hypothetical protein
MATSGQVRQPVGGGSNCLVARAGPMGRRNTSSEFYSQESKNLKSFAGVDLAAALFCAVRIEHTRKGRLSWEDIVAASGWCFRSLLAARGCVDHRNRFSHS